MKSITKQINKQLRRALVSREQKVASRAELRNRTGLYSRVIISWNNAVENKTNSCYTMKPKFSL